LNPATILRTALWSLGRNKVRTGLTMLGIIIGVASVVGMVSLGQGALAAVEERIAAMGLNVVTVTPGSKRQGGHHAGAGSVTTLIFEDVPAILRECPSVLVASPIVRSGAQIVFQNKNHSTTVQGAAPEFLTIQDRKLRDGAIFDQDQVRSGAKVCVIGETVLKELFGSVNPIGEVLRIKKIPFLVVGILESKGQSSTGQDQDDLVVAPWTTVQRKLTGTTYLNSIVTSARNESLLDSARDEIKTVLRRRHRIRPGDEEDFAVQTQTEVAAARQETTRFMMTLVVVVALVALLVGGIGVMNIMLVTVLERTREIGIRMALGARPTHVLLQFLGEATVLTSLGGTIGIALGMGFSFVIPHLVGWPTKLTAAPMIGSFLFSAGVGIFFGLYPALRASRLDPIEALRYE